jgi:hypothetical protein
MSAREFEIILARLYCDEVFLKSFLSDPKNLLADFNLDEKERIALQNIDRQGLILAFYSFDRKRKKRKLKKKSLFTHVSKMLSTFLTIKHLKPRSPN